MLPSTVALCSQGFAADRGAQFPLALATIARWWNCGLGDLRRPPPRGRGGYLGSAGDLGAFFHAEASRSLAVATIARWWNSGLGDSRRPPPRGRGGYLGSAGDQGAFFTLTRVARLR
jgi:hypothetical protein